MTTNLQNMSERKSPLFKIEGSKIKLNLTISHSLEFNALSLEQKVKQEKRFKPFLQFYFKFTHFQIYVKTFVTVK